MTKDHRIDERVRAAIGGFVAATPREELAFLSLRTFSGVCAKAVTGWSELEEDARLAAISGTVSLLVGAGTLEAFRVLHDPDDREHELEAEDLEAFDRTGILIHPETGDPVADPAQAVTTHYRVPGTRDR